MGISVTGLGSGLDYDSWIEALVGMKKVNIDKVTADIKSINTSIDKLNEIETSYNDLLTSIKSFTTAISKNNAFNQKTVSSSGTAVTAEVSAYAKVQDVDVTVTQLATSTVAKSSTNVMSYADSSTKLSELSNGAIKDGTFSIYVNGKKNEISVTGDTTLGDLVSTINDSAALDGVSASLSSDGKLTITSDDKNNYTVTLGSSSDTSNFLNIAALTGTNSTFTSAKSLSDTNVGGALVGTTFANGTITEGSFTIGNATFTVNSTTKMEDLVNSINKSKDAGATAYWDATAGKLVLTSTNQGAVNINLEAGSATDAGATKSNFLYVMGLTNSDGSALASNTQTLGQNAILSVNGTTIVSSSNTVTSDVTGITGLTLKLTDETDADVKVSVTSDTTKIEESLQTFVDNLNTIISLTDDATASDGELYGESILKSLRNKLRTLTTASTGEDGDYSVLASIGITTKLQENADGTKSTIFELNKTTLQNALSDNTEAVQELLVGDGSGNGVLNKLQTVTENSLNQVNGYFTTKENAFEKKIDRLDDKVTRMTSALETYRVTLEAKFSAMDKLISAMKNSASIFDSYFNNDNKDS